MHILCTEFIEVPTALLKWESSAEEIQLAAKDLVQSINSDHIFGNTSLQKRQKKSSQINSAIRFHVFPTEGACGRFFFISNQLYAACLTCQSMPTWQQGKNSVTW